MKKTLLIAAMLIATASFGQKKDSTTKQSVDTLVQTMWRLNDLRSFINAIERAVDSKSLSREMIDMLSRNSQILQPADKPKEVAKPKQ